MQARYYDPVIGRFLSIDPVGFTPDQPFMFNRYAYVGNDPVNAVDPTGGWPVLARSSFMRDTRRVAGQATQELVSAGKNILGNSTVYVSIEASVIIGTFGWEGEIGIGYDGKSGEGFAFVNETKPSEPLVDAPNVAGVSLGANVNVGVTGNSENLTSESISFSGDAGVYSGSVKIDADSGMPTAVEIGIGLGLGGNANVTEGGEVQDSRTCLDEKCQ